MSPLWSFLCWVVGGPTALVVLAWLVSTVGEAGILRDELRKARKQLEERESGFLDLAVSGRRRGTWFSYHTCKSREDLLTAVLSDMDIGCDCWAVTDHSTSEEWQTNRHRTLLHAYGVVLPD